jgi:Permuted papain-like amidase enzyme, YaeF/YiiX, C92 family
MGYPKGISFRICLAWVTLLALNCTICCCNSPTAPNASAVNKMAIEQMNSRINDPYNKHATDSGVCLLHTGDLVVRRGIDASSFLLSQLNRHQKKYSHCGLVIIEHGYPFVYHFIGGEDNPNERMRRDSASFFFSPKYNLSFGIYRFCLSTAMQDTLIAYIKQQYKQKKKFDMYFDLQSDDRLYCSEFVYKAFTKAYLDSNWVKPESYMGYKFVGIDNLYSSTLSFAVWQVNFK